MILKKRGKELEVLKLEALDRRLPIHHPMKGRVEKDLRIKRTEVRGEKEVDYPLGFLNKEDFFILHNLRLLDENGYFQIDSLLLNEKFFLILEVKNWYGTILFDQDGQVIRIGDDGIEEGFNNPIPQAKLQVYRLRKWLRLQGIENINIHYFVVISFPNTIIKSVSPDYPVPEKVIHNHQLFFKTNTLDKSHETKKITKDEMMTLAKKLIKAHTPPDVKLLEKYKMNEEQLIKGVICPGCHTPAMKREHGKWRCLLCGLTSEDAHKEALNDYKLLIGDHISNHGVRGFLQIDSPHVAKRLMLNGNYVRIGNKKARQYKLKLIKS